MKQNQYLLYLLAAISPLIRLCNLAAPRHKRENWKVGGKLKNCCKMVVNRGFLHTLDIKTWLFHVIVGKLTVLIASNTQFYKYQHGGQIVDSWSWHQQQYEIMLITVWYWQMGLAVEVKSAHYLRSSTVKKCICIIDWWIWNYFQVFKAILYFCGSYKFQVQFQLAESILGI